MTFVQLPRVALEARGGKKRKRGFSFQDVPLKEMIKRQRLLDEEKIDRSEEKHATADNVMPLMEEVGAGLQDTMRNDFNERGRAVLGGERVELAGTLHDTTLLDDANAATDGFIDWFTPNAANSRRFIVNFTRMADFATANDFAVGTEERVAMARLIRDVQPLVHAQRSPTLYWRDKTGNWINEDEMMALIRDGEDLNLITRRFEGERTAAQSLARDAELQGNAP